MLAATALDAECEIHTGACAGMESAAEETALELSDLRIKVAGIVYGVRNFVAYQPSKP